MMTCWRRNTSIAAWPRSTESRTRSWPNRSSASSTPRASIKSVGDDGLQRASSPRVSERFAVLVRYPRRYWEVFALIRRDVLAKTGLLAPFTCSDVVLGIELGLLGRFVLVPEPLFLNRHHPERFSQAVLVDRTASLRWWNNSGRARLIDLCPTWQIQTHSLRAIRKHVANRWERTRLYLTLLRHVLTRYTLSRLVIEPITAADPRILMAGRRVKRWLQARKGPQSRRGGGQIRSRGAEMKVVILAGGKGSRLAEETGTKSKAMVRIGDDPILWHIMKYYSSFGLSHFVVALGYQAESIKKYFEAEGSGPVDRGRPTHDRLSEIGAGLDRRTDRHRPRNFVGGRIKRLAPYLDTDPFMLTYCDGLAERRSRPAARLPLLRMAGW